MRVFLALLMCVSVSAFAQNVQQAVDQQVNKLLQQNEISAQDTEWVIKDQHTSRTSGVHHVYYRQVINEIEVLGSESSVHLMSNGAVLKANSKFINTQKVKDIASATPTLTPAQAVQSAASHFNYTITEALTEISSLNNPARETVLSGAGVSLRDIPARLVYHTTEGKKLRLAWDIAIYSITGTEAWNVFVDAQTGEIMSQVSWMSSCNFDHDHGEHPLNYNENLYDIPNYGEEVEEAPVAVAANTYEVFPVPVESPYYTTPEGTRTVVTDPANPIASPFGWHDTDGVAGPEFTVTEGNNTDTFENGDNVGYQVDGGATLDFVGYPFGIDFSAANQYEDASLTNLFYWTNVCHDIKYIYGFDEASGNFQVNNYGNGGVGNDPVEAECQDGAGSCNATMFTPADGSRPAMSMFTCGDKDGSFDNLVIVHEYAHGTTNRLTGGPSNVGCLGNSEQMGEGWSDYYGVVFTIEPGDTGADSRGVGTYLFDQGAGGPGIRPFPYSTDFGTNPQTYGDIGSLAIPHGVGSVWCTILWEVTWALIDEHGYDPDFYNFTGDVNVDAGNIQALALVTEALKLQPCSPGFVDGRDAIFAADVALYGGANECLLWDAFAARGLGASADQGSSGSTTDGTESFDSPVPAIDTAETVCEGQGVQTYGGGTPVGGVYSGPGVTDNGDGLTYDFDPAVAGVGTHTISYDVTTACASGAATDTIEVTDDIPEIICQDHTLELDANGEATLEIADVVANLIPGGLAIDQSGTFNPIDISGTGTVVNLGDDAVSDALPIGFDFYFIDATYTDFYISSNGFISFQPGDNGCCTGAPIPTAGGVDNYIALAWEDLDPNGGSDGTIRYETIGTAPDRILVMEYDNVPFWPGGGAPTVTSQVQLYEGTNRIEIHSTDVQNDGGSTTQGVEDATGAFGIATPGRNSQAWTASNDYVAFYYADPTAPENCETATNITLSQSDFTCLDFGANTVTVTITDANGNTASCDAIVTVTDPLDVCELGVNDSVLDRLVGLFPNPTSGQLTLVNNSNLNLENAIVTDVNGRTIQQIDLSDAGTTTNISLDRLASGLYFVQINTEDSSTVKRIVKQ